MTKDLTGYCDLIGHSDLVGYLSFFFFLNGIQAITGNVAAFCPQKLGIQP